MLGKRCRDLVLALLAGTFAAGCGCGGSKPPVLPDSGTDAGPPADAGVDSGTPDAGGKRDGGPCDVELQDCAADAGSCLYFSLDGGLGSDTACFTGDCDLVRQDCPSGQKCTYVGTDAGTYVRGCTLEGTAEEGQPCAPTTTSNSCKRGLICSTRAVADGGSERLCSQFCNKKSDCPGALDCYVVLRFEGSVERPLTCGPPPPSCDLLAQDCPNASDGCYPGDGNVGRCFPAGSVASGGACMYSNDCQKRSLCVNLATRQCKELCSYPTGPVTCTTGTCKPLSLPDAGYCG